MKEILKYYPLISDRQRSQFADLHDLYSEWNRKINVISRKDIDNLYLHHVLHSLSIAEVIHFRPESMILDLGCGGGFPGIPLAIMFPDAHFHLVDSIGKKLIVCNAVAESIGLQNIHTTHSRGENLRGVKYDFVVSRAAMSIDDLIRCTRKNLSKEQHNSLPNGIIALKGGDINSEISHVKSISTIWNISDFYSEDYFKEKKIVHITIK